MPQHIIDDPGTSAWLRDALRTALECDAVDVANDAELLALILHRRAAAEELAAAVASAHGPVLAGDARSPADERPDRA